MPSRTSSRKTRIAVCLVERNALAASYLRMTLKRDSRIEMLPEGEKTLRSAAAWTLSPTIFAIDGTTLPGSLVGYLAILRSRVRDGRILLLGEGSSATELQSLLFLGIRGFVPYSEVDERLCSAVRALSKGERWFAPEVSSESARYSEALWGVVVGGKSVEDILTSRERLVMGLVERRLGNKEIASTLRVSESTVKFHLANVFAKLAVRDRRSAAELAASLAPGHFKLIDSER